MIRWHSPPRLRLHPQLTAAHLYNSAAVSVAVFVAVSTAVSMALQLACPAVEKFCRASSAGGRRNLQPNFVHPDRVGRRGLSEPGGIFSRLLTHAIPWLYPRLYPWLHPWIQPQHPHHIQLETSLRIFSRLNQMIIKTAPAIAHRNPKPMLNKPISCVADWDIAGLAAPLFSTAAI